MVMVMAVASLGCTMHDARFMIYDVSMLIPRFLFFHLHSQFPFSFTQSSINVAEAQRMAKKAAHRPLEMRASASDNAKGEAFFSENADKIKADLLKYGAIWFRGFDLMKSVEGYRSMHESLGLDPCLDPLHSSGLRKFSSERDALYEEVRFFVNLISKRW